MRSTGTMNSICCQHLCQPFQPTITNAFFKLVYVNLSRHSVHLAESSRAWTISGCMHCVQQNDFHRLEPLLSTARNKHYLPLSHWLHYGEMPAAPQTPTWRYLLLPRDGRNALCHGLGVQLHMVINNHYSHTVLFAPEAMHGSHASLQARIKLCAYVVFSHPAWV